MSGDEYEFDFGKPVDSDYVDRPDKKPADVSINEDEREMAAKGQFWTNEESGVTLDTGMTAGPGAETDNLIDMNAIEENDGRSTGRTFFYGKSGEFSEPVSESGPYHNMDRGERLAKYNDGWRINDNTRATQNSKVFQRKFCALTAEQLGLTPNQAKRVEGIVMGINLRHMGPYATETVVLSAATLVADEDAIDAARRDDVDELRWIREERAYREMLDDLDLDGRTVRKCRNLVKRKTDYEWKE